MFYLRYQIKERFFGHPEHQFAFYGYFFLLSFVSSGLSLSDAVFEYMSTSTFREQRLAIEYSLHIAIGVASLWNFVIATAALITGIAYLLRDPFIPTPSISAPPVMTYREDNRESPIVRYHESVLKASVTGWSHLSRWRKSLCHFAARSSDHHLSDQWIFSSCAIFALIKCLSALSDMTNPRHSTLIN